MHSDRTQESENKGNVLAKVLLHKYVRDLSAAYGYVGFHHATDYSLYLTGLHKDPRPFKIDCFLKLHDNPIEAV